MIVGFACCAALTALSGGAGILSLKNIQTKMVATGGAITELIDQQDRQTRRFAELRGLIDQIFNAKDTLSLGAADQTLARLRRSTTESDDQITGLLRTIDTLRAGKNSALVADDQLATLRERNDTLLAKIIEAVAEAADSSEFDAIMGIDDTLGGINDTTTANQQAITRDLDSLSEKTTDAVAVIRAALTLQGRGHEVDATLKDAILATDPATVDYTGDLLKTLHKNAEADIAVLPETDETSELTESFGKLFELADNVLHVKRQMLAGDRPGVQTELDDAVAKLDLSLENASGIIIGLVDTLEFESILAVDDAMTEIKEATDAAGKDTLVHLKSLAESTSNGIATIKAAMSIRENCQQLSALTKEAFLARDTPTVDMIGNSVSTLIAGATRELASADAEDLSADFDALRKTIVGMLDAKKRMIRAEADLVVASADVSMRMAELDAEMLARAQATKTRVDKTLGDIGHEVVRSQKTQTAFATGAIAFALVVGTWVLLSITRPLGKMIVLLKDIAQGEGDLTRRLNASSRDEFGELARWFNMFADKLRAIIRNIATNTVTVTGSAAALSTTATEMASGAAKMSRQSASVASAAAQMSANMHDMAASTQQVTASIKHVASSVEEMTASIGEIARNADQASTVAGNAAHLARRSNETIHHLGEAADQIGKVIETIDVIARQVNLLALNATIEAARAGTAGKGFAVVAGEVKRLANQTARATDEIRERIDGIQASTGEAVDSIGQISDVIRQVNEVSQTIASAVKQQNATTRAIAENVSQTSHAAETISSGVTQSATACQEVTRNITGVDHAIKQTAHGAEKSQTAGTQLTSIANQLQRLVDQFKTEDE